MHPLRALALSALLACTPRDADTSDFDLGVFRAPPADLGPHVRWWWPGGAVDDATIGEEVGEIAAAGFAGIEQQTLLFGLGPDDLAADRRVRTVGTAEQLAHLRTFTEAAKARGLRTSITLGSGWPSGGAFSVDVRPQELLLTRVDLTGPQRADVPIPAPAEPAWVGQSNAILAATGPFDPTATLLAVLLAPVVDAAADPPILGAPVDVTDAVIGDRVQPDVPEGAFTLIFVHQHTVDHLVVGAAFPGDGADAHVVDHLDPRGASTLIAEQCAPWIAALEPFPPDELFIDSFEFVSELPWSTAFAARFAEAKGYDITPWLPFIHRARGEAKYVDILRGAAPPAAVTPDDAGERAREDYEDVRAELFRASFLEPMAAFAEDRGAALRLQAHGGYAPALDGYAVADVPETEGLFAAGATDFLKLASSAAHVAGRSIVSSESFVAVNPADTPLSLDERWMLAGRAYAAGVQRLVFHGLAYPYTRQTGARWYPFQPGDGAYVASPIPITTDLQLDDPDLPAFNLALTRLSYAMTRGADRAEVAWLLDEPEIPDTTFLRLGELPPEQGESATSLQLRRAGLGYDRVSPAMLAAATAEDGRLYVGEASYDALLITDWPAADPTALAAVTAAVDAGVPVVVQGRLPERARGRVTGQDAEVAGLVASIADRVAPASDDVATALLGAGVEPALTATEGTTCVTVSTAHRAASSGDLFLLFHEHADPCSATLRLRGLPTSVRLLDPQTGEAVDLPAGDAVTVELEGGRPVVLFVGW